MLRKGEPIITYSWKKYVRDANLLADRLAGNKYKFILAVTKSGLIPAYYIAERLGIKTVKTISLSSYKNNGVQGQISEHNFRGETTVKDIIVNPKDWLIVDDYSDTGFTVEYLRREYPGIDIAVVVQNINSISQANYYGKEVSKMNLLMPYK